jgi:hypothetical protein
VVVAISRDASPWVYSATGGLAPSIMMVRVAGKYIQVPAIFTGRRLPGLEVSQYDV